jgi:hypothetical protein
MTSGHSTVFHQCPAEPLSLAQLNLYEQTTERPLSSSIVLVRYFPSRGQMANGLDLSVFKPYNLLCQLQMEGFSLECSRAPAMLCECLGDFPSAYLGNLEIEHPFLASDAILAATQWAVSIQWKIRSTRCLLAQIATWATYFSVI